MVGHLMDYFKAGTCDSVWIPKVAAEGWIIITADRGRASNGVKLPSICAEYKVTHILMSGAMHKLKQSQKANAIISVWEQIKQCDLAPRGSRFIMRLHHDKRTILRSVPYSTNC